ncbi:MAG TPA: TIGR03557 family F420-dependent LLM class oxidoreductase [Candidatus Saccharimonadia bacterium]|jgi:G6PDH family F420-dependent oxidoreductase
MATDIDSQVAEGQEDEMKIGYTLSSEEFSAPELLRYAAGAEEAGFDFVGISDHFAPWTETQGNSPFSWTVIGALSQVTERMEVFVEVVCPIMRYHPAIVAQAAATSASLLEGRFVLGLGTGELLNEHIVGRGWPRVGVRREMLSEAIDIIRKLWRGGMVSHNGQYFQLDDAKIYSLPRELPKIVVSAFGPKALALAASKGDGLVSLMPDRKVIEQFDEQGGAGKPKYGQMHVCYAHDEDEARQTAYKYWPVAGVARPLMSELRLPSYFQEAAETIDEQTATKSVVLGPDPRTYVEQIRKFREAGYDHVYMHQIGPNQREFLEFCRRELRPELESVLANGEQAESWAWRAEERQLLFRESLDEADRDGEAN